MSVTINLLGGQRDHDFDEPLGLLTDCHRRIERFLSILERAVRDHSAEPLEPSVKAAVQSALTYFCNAAPKHTADEEVSLFPRMKQAAGAGAPVAGVIERLEQDHVRADALHERTNQLVREWLERGQLTTEQVRELTGHLTALRALYDEHIRTEETEVFPLAHDLLLQSQIGEVGAEMKARRGLNRSQTHQD